MNKQQSGIFEKIAKILCSEFSKLVKCFSISFGGEKCTDYKVCISASPEVCQSGSIEASHDFGHPSLSVSHFVLLSSSLGVSQTRSCARLAGPCRRCPHVPLPSPGFPRYLLNKSILLRIGHLLPRCCFSRLLRKVHASADPQLLCLLGWEQGCGLSPSSTFAWGPPAPRPCCLPLGLMKGERSFQHLPHATYSLIYLIMY